MSDVNFEAVKCFAQKMGQYAEDMWRSATIGGSQKSDESPVTIVDTYINDAFISFIEEMFPGDGVEGEEKSIPSTNGVKWIIDPLDGTRPFSAGMPNFSIAAIARVENGQVTHAVICVPVTRRLFYAVRGEGAWLEEFPLFVPTRLVVSAQDTFAHSTVFAQCRKSSMFDAYSLAEALSDRKANNLSTGSIIEETTYIARGGLASREPAVAAVYHVDKLYDAAAPSLIIEEAGGKVTDFYGNPIDWDKSTCEGALFSNGILHDELVQLACMCRRRT